MKAGLLKNQSLWPPELTNHLSTFALSCGQFWGGEVQGCCLICKCFLLHVLLLLVFEFFVGTVAKAEEEKKKLKLEFWVLLQVMETSRNNTRVCIVFLYLTLATISFTQCEARRSMRLLKAILPSPTQHQSLFLRAANKLNLINRIDFPLEGSKDIQPYAVDSPFTLPPYDSLPPISMPENAPPYCTTPPNTPQTPSTTVPTPIVLSPPSPSSPFVYVPPTLPLQSPPPSPTSIVPGPPQSISTPNPPETVPSPTGFVPGTPQSIPTPNPPESIPSPPESIPSPPGVIPSPVIYIPSPPYFEPSPPGLVPSPPSSVPSPIGFQPSPPVFLPPIVFPPPTTPPSPRRGPTAALWCVAKPSVPDPIIEEAMNYACGSGAECASIQPNGSCFMPDTLFAHASYAFNSYWQRTKVAGGTCSFGGTAMLVTVDPSYDGCRFVYY